MIEPIKMNRAWGVTELALRYFPDSTPSNAYCKFRRWIIYEPGLKEELLSNGWQPFRKILTPKQVRILVEHFGEP